MQLALFETSAPEAFIKKQESRGFDYARQAYTDMQKIKAEVK